MCENIFTDNFLPTAYVGRDGRLYFHFVYQSTPGEGCPGQVQLGEGGVPQSGPVGGGVYPGQVQLGVPQSGPAGGYPHPALDRGWVPPCGWGYPIQPLMGGTPIQPWTVGGYPPIQGWMGVPPWFRDGGKPPSSDGGTPLQPGMGYSHLDLGWGSPLLGQQKEYSLCGGRYASCVHAGGLFCCNLRLKKVSSVAEWLPHLPHPDM